MNNLKFFLLGFMLWTATSNAQSLDTRKSFILIGASVEIPKNHTISLYGGYSVEDHIQLTHVASNFKINKILSFTPSYTYMSAPLGRKVWNTKHIKLHLLLLSLFLLTKSINGLSKTNTLTFISL